MARNDPIKEVNALQVLARWWMDSFVVTGPGIQLHEYVDVEAQGFEVNGYTDTTRCLHPLDNVI